MGSALRVGQSLHAPGGHRLPPEHMPETPMCARVPADAWHARADLLGSEGSPKVTAASKRESRAGSRSCRRLVAPTTMLLLCGPKPSSWRSSTPSSRRVASCISELRSTSQHRITVLHSDDCFGEHVPPQCATPAKASQPAQQHAHSGHVAMCIPELAAPIMLTNMVPGLGETNCHSSGCQRLHEAEWPIAATAFALPVPIVLLLTAWTLEEATHAER